MGVDEKKNIETVVVNEVSSDSESPEYVKTEDGLPPMKRENVFNDDLNWIPSRRALFFGRIWDAFAKPPNERKYLLKLDLFILSYALFSYGLKSIDVNNISNAYVSGMKEELGLYGQERNLFTTFFNIGYLVGSTPSQIIINRVRPSIWIPLCEFIWSIIVMCIAAAHNARTIYGLRFMLGIFESCSYPGFAYILGCWYGPDELAKRMGVYDLAGYAANMFAGYIQTGIYTGLNGACGLSGWRWMFIIDGIMGFPICAWGFYSVPDFPNNTRARWLTKQDRELGLVRMAAMGKKSPKKLTPKRFFDMFFRSWRPWPFMVSYVLLWINGTTSYFNLWLKATGRFSVQQINLIPTGGYALGLVTGFLFANLSDRTKNRFGWLMLATWIRTLGAILLAIWNLPFGAIFFANLCGYMSEPVWSILLAWASEEFQDDAELRGLLAAVGNSIGASFSMWVPLLIFPTPQAPHYKLGYKVLCGFNGIDMLALIAFLYLSKREHRDKVQNAYGLWVSRDDYLIHLQEIEDRERDELSVVPVNSMIGPTDIATKMEVKADGTTKRLSIGSGELSIDEIYRRDPPPQFSA
ncbi:major facilitator superfamily domain-containing protein [Lipomyces oligophaga]|uniref:major facilitator superfamily domain-containing protein n=1 Tax=Lipomyces oligophaga TaxID=45792 RepID=UPI0034CFC7E5